MNIYWPKPQRTPRARLFHSSVRATWWTTVAAISLHFGLKYYFGALPMVEAMLRAKGWK